MEYKMKKTEHGRIPGYDRMCASGCPRTENLKTELTGTARRDRYGGPEGYWGI